MATKYLKHLNQFPATYLRDFAGTSPVEVKPGEMLLYTDIINSDINSVNYNLNLWTDYIEKNNFTIVTIQDPAHSPDPVGYYTEYVFPHQGVTNMMLATNGTNYVSCANGILDNTIYFATSTNGIAWILQSTTFTGILLGLVWDGINYVCSYQVSSNIYATASATGVSWTTPFIIYP
jgi:hypothetical protein